MSVLLPWAERLSYMQQSVLITATRGPDTLPKMHPAKYLCRWLRRAYLYSAFDKVALWDPRDPRGGNFTGPIGSPDDALRAYLDDVDSVPHHFHMHLVHAAEILGYKHPDKSIRDWWLKAYHILCGDLHLGPETEADMDCRLGDIEHQWRGYCV